MTYLHAAFAQEGNRISIKSKQFSIVFLVLFSFCGLYCGTSSIIAEFLLRYSGIIFCLTVKAIRLQNSKINVHAAFAQEDNRIAPKDNNIVRYL